MKFIFQIVFQDLKAFVCYVVKPPTLDGATFSYTPVPSTPVAQRGLCLCKMEIMVFPQWLGVRIR